jgi:choline-sulfatase
MNVFKTTMATLLFGTLFSSLVAQQTSTSRPPRFKNVVFIVGDDHSANVVGAYGNKIIRTPNLDRMAKRGILFEHAYTSSPLCSPSRQSILTGKYPHATGVSLLNSSFPQDQVTIADYLTPKGFKTALIGKNHFNNTLNHGFELKIERKDYENYIKIHPPTLLDDSIKVRPPWKPFKDPANIWLNAEGLPSATHDADQPGTYYANKAVEFIQQNKKDRFLLWVGFEEPHSPFNFPVEFAGKYDPTKFTLPQGGPEDDRWIPAIFKDLTEDEKKGITRSYYSSVEFLDKNIGLLLDALDKAGIADSTLVVYLGDNGYQLNDHKRFEKHTTWEPSVRVPLIMQTGNQFGHNRRVQSLTSFIDLVPTAIEALGVAELPSAQGKSFLPLLANKTKAARDFVFSEYLEDNKVMVRTAKWKYVFTSGKKDLALGYSTGNPAPGPLHFLYDEINDPNERVNIIGQPGHEKIVRDLQQKMISVFEQTHPKGKLPDELSVEEKLIIYCDPPELAGK